MQIFKTNTWLFWAILIVGLGLIGACSNGNPTTPDPSDVQDIILEEGDPIDESLLADLLAEYSALVGQGGGVSTIVDDTGYTLIGCFERYTSNKISAHVVVEQATGDPIGMPFTDKIALLELDYPITVTVYQGLYVSKTIVETTANVIAFNMDRLGLYVEPSMIVGYTFNYDGELPWLVNAKSTHVNRDWVITNGYVFSDPNTLLLANAYQPVGAIAFLYDSEGEAEMGFDPGNLSKDPADYDIVGYSYSHIGSLDPGAVGAWIMNLTEEGLPNTYTDGNYTLNYTLPDDGGIAPMASGELTITPGGFVQASGEFVPYFPPTEFDITTDTGTYTVSAYDPPVIPDAHYLRCEVTYNDGASEWQYVAWDPAGAGVPDITFNDTPGTTSFDVDFDPYLVVTAEWTNVETPGMVVVTVDGLMDMGEWQIWCNSDTTDLGTGIIAPPFDSELIPGSIELLSAGDATLTVTRVACAGVNTDNFDAYTLTAGTSSELLSAGEDLEVIIIP